MSGRRAEQACTWLDKERTKMSLILPRDLLFIRCGSLVNERLSGREAVLFCTCAHHISC